MRLSGTWLPHSWDKSCSWTCGLEICIVGSLFIQMFLVNADENIHTWKNFVNSGMKVSVLVVERSLVLDCLC